jgi:hypothetical protein
MRSIFGKLVAGIAISAIGMFAAADNSLGTWKRNMEKSKFTNPGPNAVKSLTVVNEASEGGRKQTVTGERADGTAINGSSTIKYDGKPYPVTGASWDTVSVKQVDANTFTGKAKKTGGKYKSTTRTVISDDGKTMTVTSKGTNTEGNPTSATIVYDKQ